MLIIKELKDKQIIKKNKMEFEIKEITKIIDLNKNTLNKYQQEYELKKKNCKLEENIFIQKFYQKYFK